jgi:D-alanyl-lipoteichoic acid acyltransferase DltB (MBOAT superfamily)
MLWGFFKKMVIADRAAPLVQTAFAEYASMNGNNVLLGAFLYSLQIYADFSGYMDIVCGLCQILGIELTENFERPYFSKSVAEYWRRWHMSLGAWFKTYVYYPVAVSRFAKKCTALGTNAFGRTFGKTVGASIALIVVWFATGFWHGASWAYITWGGVNGLAIILSLWMEPLFAKAKTACRINELGFAWRAFATLRTFFLVTLIKVFPEVGGFQAGLGYWKHCFTNWNLTLGKSLLYPITSRNDLLILGIGAVLMFVTSLMQRKGSIREQISRWPAFVRYAIFVALFFAIVLLGIPTQNAGGGFLYAQF